jgi:hypothetical protein
MPPVLLHIVLLAVLAVPMAVAWLRGQPGHQATAAAWAVGLLFVAGLWLAHAIVSSGLLFWRSRTHRLTLAVVVALQIASALIVLGALYLGAWILGAT